MKMKKRKQEDMHIRHALNYLGCLRVTCLLMMMSVLLLSCDKDEAVAGEGSVVTLKVSAATIENEDHKDLTRAAGPVSPHVNTVAGTRTSDRSPLATGKKFKVLAFEQGKVNSSGYISQGDFVMGGKTIDKKLHVKAGSTYTFVCYSGNSAGDLPDFSATDYSVDQYPDGDNGDLLYAKFDKKITADDKNLSISFVHQFPRIKLIADASSIGKNITAMAPARIECHKGRMNLSNGTMTALDDTRSCEIGWGSITPGETVTSDASQVYVTDKTISVTLPSVTIGDVTLKDLKATFTNVTLEAGTVYSLRLKFVGQAHPGLDIVFAGSNIYWDGTKLTFDNAGVTSHQKYQGVVFKYGSLVGISPALDNGSADFSTATTPLFVPDVSTNASWSQTTADAMSWSWDDIPYVSTGSDKDASVNYLFNEIGTSGYSEYKGDICKYLSDKGYAPSSPNGWRMPTEAEFGEKSDYVADDGPFAVALTTDASGKAEMLSGYTFSNAYFPASGSRSYGSGGVSEAAGKYGRYWSGSVYSSSYTYAMIFYGTGMSLPYAVSRTNQYTVRCVKIDYAAPVIHKNDTSSSDISDGLDRF